MASLICWKCKRAVTPLERLERDPKTKKRWLIKYCPYPRCSTNLELDQYIPAHQTGRYLIDELNVTETER